MANVKDLKQKLDWQLKARVISEDYYNTEMHRLLIIEDAADDLKKAMDKDLAGAVADLKAKASDAEFKAAANKGTEDGQPEDEKVPFNTTPIPATKMFPTQAEIGFGNSLDDIINDKYGAIDAAFTNPVKMPSPDGKIPVLCAEVDGQIAILDGHHRWSLCFMINPKAQMMCDIMKAPAGMGAEDALKAMQLAIAAKAGKVVTKPFEGKDLMATSTEEVIKYVTDNIGKAEVQKFAKYAPEIFTKVGLKVPNSNRDAADGKNRAAVAKYIGKSHALIINMKGPYPRTIMPQAGKSGDSTTQTAVNTAFQSGEINFKEPFKESATKAIDKMLKEAIEKGKA